MYKCKVRIRVIKAELGIGGKVASVHPLGHYSKVIDIPFKPTINDNILVKDIFIEPKKVYYSTTDEMFIVIGVDMQASEEQYRNIVGKFLSWDSEENQKVLG